MRSPVKKLFEPVEDFNPDIHRAAFAALVRIGRSEDWPPLEQAAFARPEGPTDQERVGLVRLGRAWRWIIAAIGFRS